MSAYCICSDVKESISAAIEFVLVEKNKERNDEKANVSHDAKMVIR